ncbi:unnamed protein product, partial [Medioppia subpectinata]
MVVTYFRGAVTESDKKIAKGLMAVVGLSKAEAKKVTPGGCYLACNNSKDNVVISDLKDGHIGKTFLFAVQKQSFKQPNISKGPKKEMSEMIKRLEEKATPVPESIKKYIPNPRLRSRKWVSTSLMTTDPSDQALKYASAEYFVYNLMNPVLFIDKLKDLPTDAIILELSPHSIFPKVVSETLDNSAYVSLIKRNANDTNLDTFMAGLATLYESGVNLSIEKLYPVVEWPVARNTQSISSLMRWDHNRKFEHQLYPQKYCRLTAGDYNFPVDPSKNQLHAFYLDHAVDGNALFPATGYLMLAWRKLAVSRGKAWYQLPVIFENVQLKRAVFVNDVNKTDLIVKYFPNTDEFCVLENDNVCVVGKVRTPDDEVLLTPNAIFEIQKLMASTQYSLDRKDIYKELGVVGLDYGPHFQRLKRIQTNDFRDIYGINEWDGNFVTYLDAMLQSMVFSAPFRKLMVPVMIRTIRVDPRVFFENVIRNRNVEQKPIESMESEESAAENLGTLLSVGGEMVEVTKGMTEDEKVLKDAKVIYKEEMTRKNERFFVFSADMPFHFNAKSKRLVAHGLEVEDLMAFPIPRRADGTDLVLDTYQFFPNEDLEAVDAIDKRVVTEYIEVCKAMAAKIKLIGYKDIKCDFNYQNISDDVIQEYRTTNNENHVLFRIFDKILTEVVDKNKNSKNSKEVMKVLKDIESGAEYDLNKDLINQIQKNEHMIRTLVDIVCENFVTIGEIKVTEINLSSGILAKEVDQIMSLFRIMPYDVDYKLVVKSKQDCIDMYKNRATKWDPKDDISLKPSHLVILRDTQDLWQKDMQSFVQDIYDCLQTNGFLLSVFRYKFTEPEIAFNSLNGKAIYNNLFLENRIKEFITICDEIGLKLICTKYDSFGTVNYEQWFRVLQKKLITAKEADNQTDNVWLMADDSGINGIVGMRLEPGGENFRYIFNMDSNSETNIDFTIKPYSDILANDLMANVIKGGKLGSYRHIKLPKDSDKVVSNEYFLNLGQTRDLAGLQCTGLSFHDVMLATGRIPSGPEVVFMDCTIGGEFAGRLAETGERVMGMESGRCFATSIYAATHTYAKIPDHWSMNDAVSILSTYSTAYYGLIKAGRLRKGESILIHSAAGGVGQSAIYICKHYECDIYVTVGNDEKKQFLMNEYNIPENKIFNSRDILFKNQIMEATEGKGVDVVLNSLSGEKLDASYSCVANHGRFVEMGRFDMGVDVVLNSLSGEKLDASYSCVANHGRFVEMGRFDMVQNKKLGMFDFVRNIDFISVVLDLVLLDYPDFLPEFYDWVHKNCTDGCVKPINQNVFPAAEAEKAFRYMTTGKHTGKIVIKTRDEETNRGPLKTIKPVPEMLVSAKTYFNPNKVYIITGGLGGFGLELIPWMQYFGARKFMVTSRSGLKTDYQKFIYNRIHSVYQEFKFFESEWFVSTANGFTIEGTKQLISEALKLGPIGGIFTNLDQLTRQLDYKLDYFVVFSSVACGKGSPGQSNYSFGNSICERICEERRRDGLHGLAIQYGPVGDVGVFKDSDQLLSLTTLRKQRINSCCDVLDKLLSIKQPIVTSYVKVDQTKDDSISRGKRMIRELWRALGIDPEITPNHLTLGEIGIESMFAVELQQELERDWNIENCGERWITPNHLTLGEIGIESMFAVELQQELERDWNTKISLNQVKTITIGMLKDIEAGVMGQIKKHIDDIKRARLSILKLNFVMPTQTHTSLNTVAKGTPIYFMPPILVSFSAMEELAQRINRPVIGLNWTREVSALTTMKEVTAYYVNLLKTLEPKGKCDVLGYFDGAIICSKYLLKGMVGRAVIIDVIDDSHFRDEYMTDEYILDFLLSFLSSELPDSFKQKILRDLKKEQGMNGKLKYMGNELGDFAGKSLVTTDMQEIFEIVINRIHMLSKYRMEKRKKLSNKWKTTIGKKWSKKTGKLVVIKPFQFELCEDVDETLERARDAYFLPGS